LRLEKEVYIGAKAIELTRELKNVSQWREEEEEILSLREMALPPVTFQPPLVLHMFPCFIPIFLILGNFAFAGIFFFNTHLLYF
jgi:hypothetical protein